MKFSLVMNTKTHQVFVHMGNSNTAAAGESRMELLWSLTDETVYLIPEKEFQGNLPNKEINHWGNRKNYMQFHFFDSPLSLFSTDKLVTELSSREDNPFVGVDPDNALDDIWQTDFLAGNFIQDFNTDLEVVEDFNMQNIFPTKEEAFSWLEKNGNEETVLLKRFYQKVRV